MWTLLSVSNITKLVCVDCISCITDRCWCCLEEYYNAKHCIQWVTENTATVLKKFLNFFHQPLGTLSVVVQYTLYWNVLVGLCGLDTDGATGIYRETGSAANRLQTSRGDDSPPPTYSIIERQTSFTSSVSSMNSSMSMSVCLSVFLPCDALLCSFGCQNFVYLYVWWCGGLALVV